MSKNKDAVPNKGPHKIHPLATIHEVAMSNRATEKNYLLGKILTIIDASISDPEQRKGLKDLIRDSWHQKTFFWHEYPDMLNQFRNKYCKNLEEVISEGSEGRVAYRERPYDLPDYFAE